VRNCFHFNRLKHFLVTRRPPAASRGTQYVCVTKKMKNTALVANIIAVENHPRIVIPADKVSFPIALGLRTISIIAAITGAASTPLTTAAQ